MSVPTSLHEAHRIVVLSGAGLSTAAGIPDFRGPEGLWTRDPYAELVSTLSWYLRDDDVRKAAWRRRADPAAWAARPTLAHRAIVELERQGRLRAIVTQNTDGLHQLAGSSPELVHEVHGSMRTWRCERCGTTGPMEEMVARVRAGDEDPRCPSCGGITRATVILFEEVLDADVLQASVDAVEDCDAIVAVGTTLGVYPVAGLFPLALERDARGVIVNASETAFDDVADEVVRGRLDDVLPDVLGVQVA
ncbi:MAG: Sir2 family NAD-dependent protein deacetylase [Arachnia sp.]